MKRTFLTLAVSFLLSFSLLAYTTSGRSKLNIKTWNGEKFSLIIDNKSYSKPQSIYNIENLLPGKHHIIVKRKVHKRRGGSHTRTIYNGYINIPASSKVKATVQRHQKLSIVDIDPIVSVTPVVVHGNVAINNHGKHNTAINSHGQHVVPAGISSRSFQNLKHTIVRTSFDDEKLIVAQQAIASHRVSSQQVLELMKLFSFDSKKLELAKFAYAYTLDKQNYYIVNSGFTFSSSVRKLNKIGRAHV